jgi:hypothetical protein
MEDQEGWLREAIRTAKTPVDQGAITGIKSRVPGLGLHLYDDARANTLSSWVDFYFSDARKSSPPEIIISRKGGKYRTARVRGILSPLLKEEELDGVVKEIMSVQILKLRYLADGEYCAHRNRQSYVVRTQAELESVWAHFKRDPDGPYLEEKAPKLPKVDFNEHTVIAVFSGARSAGQCAISIGGVAKTKRGIEVHLARTQAAGEITPSGQAPYDIVRIQKTEEKIVIVDG